MKDLSGQAVRILVVEDDQVMSRMIVDYLEDHNIRGVSAWGRQEMARHFAEGEPDLVILDLRLDQEDGLDLLREIRMRSDVPVIITTGDRRDEIDRVVGLELGADDYVIKPFSLRELLARIRAVLRRQEAGRAAFQREPERGRSRFGDWQLNRRTRRLTDPSGTEVSLTQWRNKTGNRKRKSAGGKQTGNGEGIGISDIRSSRFRVLKMPESENLNGRI